MFGGTAISTLRVAWYAALAPIPVSCRRSLQNDGCEAFPMCGSGAQTVLCTVQGGTHCGSYGAFMIADVAWSILQHQQLP